MFRPSSNQPIDKAQWWMDMYDEQKAQNLDILQF